MRAALLIAAKDLRQRARDRSAFVMAIVVPLGLAFIFSQTLRDVGRDSVTFDYAVADQDGGATARVFVDEFLAAIEAEGLVQLTEADSPQEGRQLAEDGKVHATFIVPTGFSSDVEGGQGSEIEVVGNVDAPIGTMVATSIARSFAGRLTAVQTSVATVVASGVSDPVAIAALVERAAAATDPISVEDVSAAQKELEPKTFFAAGMAVFFLFFTVQFGISSLLDERREGTLSRLLAAPVRRSSILVGKLITSFVLGVASMGVLAASTSLLMGAEWGDPVGRDVRGSVFAAADALSIPVFVIPHGFSIFLNSDVNSYIKSIKRRTGRWPDFSGRDRCEAYVVACPHQKNMAVEWGMSPEKLRVMGSLRFDPIWQSRLLEWLPDFSPAEIPDGSAKVALMLPHWSYNVDRSATLSLAHAIADLPGVSLVVKGHTRGSGALTEAERYDLVKKRNVFIAGEEDHSPAIVRWAGTVVSFGSSISIEALLQGKRLINPAFCHSNKTIFDSSPAIVTTRNKRETIEAIQEGEVHVVSPRDLLDYCVYGELGTHDVLESYWRMVTRN